MGFDRAYDRYSRRERSPWRDIMQVCLNGHVINDGVKKHPDYNKDFCNKCGAKTITECPNCSNPIPGAMQDTGVAVLGFTQSAPYCCQSCGVAFPWTTKQEVEIREEEKSIPIETLQRVFSRFHTMVKQLRIRREARPTLDVSDEYDVQDLLRTLLFLFFDDIRLEEWTPSYAGKSARMDFLLKQENIVVEVKMTRKGLAERELGDQLLIDIERYKEHPNCETLVCFVYDPEGRIANATGLVSDLANQSREGLRVLVFINPL
jgi:hypothetical protein